mgnify:CR=1 FL=1
MVRQWQKLFYGKRYSMTDLRAGAATRRGEEHPPKYTPDFVKLAEAFGAEGYRVETEEELNKALDRAFELNTPCLIECPIPSEENVYPMVPPNGSVDNMILK